MSSSRGTDKGGPTTAPASISSIPLTDIDSRSNPATASIGTLVKDATSQVSTLVRAEVELAKAEVTGEVKKALQGSILFIAALAVLIFSSFFFFFFLAELLNVWVSRWLAFLIVFLIMLVITGLLAFVGYLRVKKLRKPAKTIDSLKATASVLPGQGDTTPSAIPTALDVRGPRSS